MKVEPEVPDMMKITKPETRVAALQSIKAMITPTIDLVDDDNIAEALMRQLRCDLYVLGVTSAELDEAELR